MVRNKAMNSPQIYSPVQLANYLKRKHKKPLLVAGDVYRPAAITQLQVLGEQLNVPVFTLGDKVSPVEIAQKAMEKAHSLACDTVIIDTAGRLHINEELMEELRNIKGAVHPQEILLVDFQIRDRRLGPDD